MAPPSPPPALATQPPSQGETVTFSCGGTRVTATLFALTRATGSHLEAIFSGRWDRALQRDREGKIFLDLDPELFLKIIDVRAYHLDGGIW